MRIPVVCKRWLGFLAAVVICIGSAPLMSLKSYAVSFTPDFEVYSEAVYLYNMDSKQVIYEKNADKQMVPASLTKIITGILALENIPDLDTMIGAPAVLFNEFAGKNASTADFRQGEEAPARDLIYGLMLQSACEAASILGNYIAGEDLPAFVEMMNKRAVELGCTNTNFINSHGLYEAGQHTTASDMAKIALHAISLPNFMEIASSLRYTTVPTNKHPEPRTLLHTVKLMDPQSKYYYAPVKGIKTGTLDESGRCLITTASKDGYNYLLVTLGAPQVDGEGNTTQYSFDDHKNLYEWAFNNFQNTTILSSSEEIDEVSVQFSESDDYVLVSPKEDYSLLWNNQIALSNIQRIVTLDEDVIAPVEKGQKLGTIELQLSGERLSVTDLVATTSLERSLLKYNLHLAKQFLNSFWFKTAIGVGVALIVIYIALYCAMNRRKKAKSYRRGGTIHGDNNRRRKR